MESSCCPFVSCLHLAAQARQVLSGGAQLSKALGIHPEQLLPGAPHRAEQEACTYKEVFGVHAAVGASKATDDREGQMEAS